MSMLVAMYVREIADPNKSFTIDDVPAGLRQKVKAALDAEDQEQPEGGRPE